MGFERRRRRRRRKGWVKTGVHGYGGDEDEEVGYGKKIREWKAWWVKCLKGGKL